MRISFIVAMTAGLLAGQAFAQDASPSNPPADIRAPKSESAPAIAPNDARDAHSVPPAADGPSNPAIKTEEGNNASRPVEGANSFTEGEAKSRIEARGFQNVTELKKDDQGVWRGKAMQDGKMVDVALDFQGNVIANPS
jgi:hypothetical protein